MKLNVIDLATFISAGGVLLSALISLLVAGIWVGRYHQRQSDLEKKMPDMASRDDIQRINERLARIEGMFELRLKE